MTVVLSTEKRLKTADDGLLGRGRADPHHEAIRTPLPISQSNLKEGYKAMAADLQRENEAKEWLRISGQTLADEAW